MRLGERGEKVENEVLLVSTFLILFNRIGNALLACDKGCKFL